VFLKLSIKYNDQDMRRFFGITSIVILFILLATGLFYWYQWRPAQIKHQCSWVAMHSDAKPGRPALTKDQLLAMHKIRSCQNEIAAMKKEDPTANYALGDMSVRPIFPSTNGGLASLRALFNDPKYTATSCIADGNQVIAAYSKPIAPVPAKDWYEPSTKEQYNFCLHDKGL
jgi:hypothetical protein